MADAAADKRPLYAVLGLEATASPRSVKAAYRRLALAHHPDRKGQAQAAASDEDGDVFARIAYAYEVLGDAQRRRRYDLTGEVPQSDAALGRGAGQTFLAEYLQAAPQAPRRVTQKDMSLHSLENYEAIDLEGTGVPDYMRAIVAQGLRYLVCVLAEAMSERQVILLRHYVMDQMYALLAYDGELDDGAFAERGYIITYYDHPLQAGITPTWSDQNEGRPLGPVAELKVIDAKVFEQRRLVALEWSTPAQTGAAAATAEVTIPGEGVDVERLKVAARALVKQENDVMTLDIHKLRARLAVLLGVPLEELEAYRSTELMCHVLEAAEMVELETEEAHALGQLSGTGTVAGPGRGAADLANAAATGTTAARVKATGRIGRVILFDPDDPELTYKLSFSDGGRAEDWFCGDEVELCSEALLAS